MAKIVNIKLKGQKTLTSLGEIAFDQHGIAEVSDEQHDLLVTCKGFLSVEAPASEDEETEEETGDEETDEEETAKDDTPSSSTEANPQLELPTLVKEEEPAITPEELAALNVEPVTEEPPPGTVVDLSREELGLEPATKPKTKKATSKKGKGKGTKKKSAKKSG